jgi:hypothetical protein
VLGLFDYFSRTTFHQSVVGFAPGHRQDKMCTVFVNSLFWDGKVLHTARTAWAVLSGMFPDILRFGGTAMPLGRLASAGFAKEAPPKSRLALPEAVVYGIITQIAKMGYMRVARGMWLGLSLHSRPGELVGLTCQQLVPPSVGGMTSSSTVILHPQELGAVSETGQFNDAPVLGGKDKRLLVAVAKAMKVSRLPLASVMGVTRCECARIFAQEVSQAGLASAMAVLCQFRHTRASRDLTGRARSFGEAKRKGRGLSDKSLNRYLKGGWTAEQFEKLPQTSTTYRLECHARLGEA